MTVVINAFGEAYFLRALLAVAALGLAGGLAGSHVLLRRSSFFVVSLSHATFPAAVIASMIGVSVIFGGLAGAVAVAAAVVVIGSHRVTGHENAVAVVVGGAFAAGIALVTLAPQSVRATDLLVGSLVAVSSDEVRNIAVAALVVAVAFITLHKELVFQAFDPVGAAAAGYRTSMLDFLALALVGIVAAAAIPAVGSLLAVSMLIVPALAARSITARLVPAMVLSSLFAMASGVAGLVASTAFDLAAGGAIATASVLLLLTATAGAGLRRLLSGAQRRSGSSGEGALGAGFSGAGTA